MKRLNFYVLAFVIFEFGCKKSNTKGLASLNIVDAVNNISSVVVNLSDTAIAHYLNQDSIAYGTYRQYGIPSGINSIVLVASNDTIKPLWKGSFNFNTGGIYSFYISGGGPAIDTMLVRDTIPVYTDSSAGVRFINLSPDSKAITINLAGNSPDQTEFAGLGYKQRSVFKKYAANGITPDYTFEIRDQATGDLLTTATWNFTIYRNTTMIIGGYRDPNSSTTINVFPVNNF